MCFGASRGGFGTPHTRVAESQHVVARHTLEACSARLMRSQHHPWISQLRLRTFPASKMRRESPHWGVSHVASSSPMPALTGMPLLLENVHRRPSYSPHSVGKVHRAAGKAYLRDPARTKRVNMRPVRKIRGDCPDKQTKINPPNHPTPERPTLSLG